MNQRRLNDFNGIKDPTWVRESEEVVQQFLEEKNSEQLDFQTCGGCIIERVPTTTSFQKAMIYCIQLIDPNSMIEEFKSDVPKILDKLGYPYRLNSGHWAGCTTPSYWPKLLYVLRWVVELCQYMDICKKDHWVVPEKPDSSISLDRELEFYSEWLKTQNMDDILEKYTEEVNEESKEEMLQFEHLQKEVEEDRAQLAEAIKRKEAQKSKILQLREAKRMIAETNSEIETVKEKISTMKTKIECKDIQIQSSVAAKLTLEKRMEDVQKKIEDQPMTSQEVEDLKSRLTELEDKTQESDLRKSYLHKNNRDMEENCRSQYTQFVSPYSNKFSQLAKELGFSSADYAGDVVFEIDPPQFADFLKNGINAGNVEEVTRLLDEAKSASEREESQSKEKMEVMNLNNHNLTNELEVLKRKQDLLEKDLRSIWDERKKMKIKNQEEIAKLQMQCEQQSFDSENKLEAIKYEAQAKEKELQSLKQEMKDMKAKRDQDLWQLQMKENPEILAITELVQEVDEMCKEQLQTLKQTLENLKNDEESFI